MSEMNVRGLMLASALNYYATPVLPPAQTGGVARRRVGSLGAGSQGSQATVPAATTDPFRTLPTMWPQMWPTFASPVTMLLRSSFRWAVWPEQRDVIRNRMMECIPMSKCAVQIIVNETSRMQTKQGAASSGSVVHAHQPQPVSHAGVQGLVLCRGRIMEDWRRMSHTAMTSTGLRPGAPPTTPGQAPRREGSWNVSHCGVLILALLTLRADLPYYIPSLK